MAYCALEDIVRLLPPQIQALFNNNNPDRIRSSLPLQEITYYMDFAASEIDSQLSAMYRVPLVRYKEGQGQNARAVYPPPIPQINALMAASMIYKKLFSEHQNPATLPKYSEEYEKEAKKLLTLILNGNTFLRGQIPRGKRYMRPESMGIYKFPGDIKGLE